MNVINSFSISSEKLINFKSLLQKKIEQYGKPSLGILFVNADLDIEGVHKFMDEYTIPHIGASSMGELCNDDFARGLYTALFMYLPENSFKIYTSQSDTSDLSGKELGVYAKTAFKNPGIFMLVASKDLQTDIFVKEVQQNSHTHIPLYGGHAMNNLKLDSYTVFADNYFKHNGIVAAVFDCDKVKMFGDAYSGWDSIGTTHVITHSIGNELLEIDEKPALDVFTYYFDYFNIDKVATDEDYRSVIGNHPIKVVESDGSSYLKSPMHINLERKSIMFYCSVPEGTKFKFCNNPQIEITDNLIERMQKNQSNEADLDCLLITSCAGRYITLGPFFKKEVKQLFKIWKKPMAGFLSGGEIGNVRESSTSYFHNVTCIFTGFKVK